jgi:hypothetical protein
MKKNIRRLLAHVLVIAIFASMLPAVYAGTSATYTVTVATLNELMNAINKATEEPVLIQLTADITLPATENGDGYSITATNEITIESQNSNDKKTLNIQDYMDVQNTTLTLKDVIIKIDNSNTPINVGDKACINLYNVDFTTQNAQKAVTLSNTSASVKLYSGTFTGFSTCGIQNSNGTVYICPEQSLKVTVGQYQVKKDTNSNPITIQ